MKVREARGPQGAPVVVFVHGAGVAGWMWNKQLEALGSLRCLAVDLPDHGTDLATPFPGIEAAADELGLLAEAQGAPVHFVGHSLGAKLVLELLSRRPEVVASAVISSALVRPSALAQLMNHHALNALSVWMLRSEAVAKLQASQFAFPDEAMTTAFLADVRAMKPENLDRPIAAFCARLFPPPGLERVACPVLLTAGQKEPGSMRGSMDDLARLIPRARTHLLEHARHIYPWAQHEAYSSLLRDWLPSA
jgi:pimeloyl-ACP methyl ester carboxylesterase